MCLIIIYSLIIWNSCKLYFDSFGKVLKFLTCIILCVCRLKAGELRRIQRKKSTEQLGINITSRDVGSGGGVFVSSVSENSLAANAGIEVGDQLLEVRFKCSNFVILLLFTLWILSCCRVGI